MWISRSAKDEITSLPCTPRAGTSADEETGSALSATGSRRHVRRDGSASSRSAGSPSSYKMEEAAGEEKAERNVEGRLERRRGRGMAGIVHKIGEALHIGGGEHKEAEGAHKKGEHKEAEGAHKKEAEGAHKKAEGEEGHKKSEGEGHKEGLMDKIKDKIHGGEEGKGEKKKKKEKEKKKKEKKHGEEDHGSSSSDSD